MLRRAVFIWFAIMLTAIVNGAIRDMLLVAPLGDQTARAISCLTLGAVIVFITWMSLHWIGPATMSHAWAIGVTWLAMTLIFEFVAGHYVFGTPWATLLADYNVLDGRLWIVVLIVTLTAPPLFHRIGHYPAPDREISSTRAPRHQAG